MGSPYTVRWGILATGGIATQFTKDLFVDPSTRDASDVKHDVVAAASSTSADRARAFLQDCGANKNAAAYGTYEELVADKNVDIVYIATPHSHHFQNALLCLNAGKNVLCEKAFTVNAAQARILADTAKAKGLFLMEAVWTRYFPLSVQVRDLVRSGKIGKVHRVIADLSIGKDMEKVWGPDHRMVNMDLAGGALLDVGIYSLTWVFQILYHIEESNHGKQPAVASSITKYHQTGADETTSIIVTFPGTGAHGIALCSFRVASDPDTLKSVGPSVRIQGTEGEIQILHPAYKPTKYRIIPKGDGKDGSKVQEVEVAIPAGTGMSWEADEAARCLRDGKLQSDGLPLEESIVIMDVMDQVRKQNDFRYPESIESTVYRG